MVDNCRTVLFSTAGSDAQVTDLEPVEAKISDAGTSDVKMMWKCLEGGNLVACMDGNIFGS